MEGQRPELRIEKLPMAKVRIMDGPTVVTAFELVAPDDGRARWWSEIGDRSLAQLRVEARLRRAWRATPADQRGPANWYQGEHKVTHSHRVALIGDEPFERAYRPEWDGVPLPEIPGYREVYVFGRLTVRAERLYELLDGVRAAGLDRVQLAALRKFP